MTRAIVRKLRQTFGISAPRMAVRTPLPWWGRGVLVAALIAVVGGMWWWGFDFGQIFGGFNRREIEARIATLEADTAKYRSEATELRALNTALESELAMTKGTEDALKKQIGEINLDNAQMKEELAFLRTLVSDTGKQGTVSIQRLAITPEGDDGLRYNVLVVRGGTPREDFVGSIVVQATLVPADDPAAEARTTILTLPDDQPENRSALSLKFKYYQRLEGRIRIPPGTRVTAVAVRAFEAGQGNPRATRTLQL